MTEKTVREQRTYDHRDSRAETVDSGGESAGRDILPGMSQTSPSPADLLAHVSWVRALARELVHDGAEAEDLAQETLVRVLEHPPRTSGALGSFLRRVLVNVRGERHRKDARRAERERRAARPEAAPAPGEIAEQLALQRELVEAVERLAAQDREAIVLRYFEELPPRRIAARLGIPVKTVDARLRRGLTRLREDFDRRSGGRERWARTWIAWLSREPAAPARPAWRGAPAWIAAALAAGGLAATWFGVQATRGSAPTVSALVREPGRTPDATELAAVQRAAERESVRARASDPPVHGRVCALDGSVLPGAEVEVFEVPFAGFDLPLDDAPALERRLGATRCDARGEFSLDAPSCVPLRVRASSEGLGSEERQHVFAGDEVVFVLAPAGALEVAVSCGAEPCAGAPVDLLRQGITGPVWTGTTDGLGHAVATGLTRGIYTVGCTPADATREFVLDVALPSGARVPVEIEVRRGASLRGLVRAEGSGVPVAGARISAVGTAGVASESNGAFELRGLRVDPGVRSWRIDVRAEGFAPASLEVPATAAPDDLVIELARGRRLRGVVVGTDDIPLEGAWVACAGRAARTGADGAFELDDLGRGAEVTFVRARGFAPSARTVPAEAADARDLGRIRLGTGCAVSGLVRTSAGQLLDGARVELAPLETSPSDSDDDETVVTIGAVESTPEDALAGASSRIERRSTRTGAQGRFQLHELAPGRYVVSAHENGYPDTEPRELTIPAEGDVPPLELVFDVGRTLSGVVRGSDGVPLANAWIVTRDAEDEGGPLQLSELDGSFVLRGVPPGALVIEASYHRYDSRGEPLYVGARLTDVVAPASGLELVLPRNHPIAGVVLDEDGQPFLGCVVRASDAEGLSLSAEADAAGRFSVAAGEGRDVSVTLFRATLLAAEGSSGAEVDVEEGRATVRAGTTGVVLRARRRQ